MKGGEYLGSGEVHLDPHASSTTKLHELYHMISEHEPGKMTVNQFIDREIDALVAEDVAAEA